MNIFIKNLLLSLIAVFAAVMSPTVFADEGDYLHQQYEAPYPLIHAVHHSNLAETKRLLAAGTNPDEVGHEGWTALMTASSDGPVSIVQLLLQHGADPNKANDNFGDTPLMMAVAVQKTAIVKELLAHGGDPHKKNKSGHSAHFVALHVNNHEILRMMKENPKKKSSVKAEKTAHQPTSAGASNRRKRAICYDTAVRYCEDSTITSSGEDRCYDYHEGLCRKLYPPDND